MKDKAEKKVPFRETIRAAWKPYKRLYTYVGPYKWRFILGLALGFLFGVTQGCLPLVLQKVTSTIFHGAAPKATDLTHRSELLSAGGSVKSIVFICLLIPAVMTVRSLMGYGNAFYMNWVSNRVVTDIRNQLFAKIVGQSMDFFNRMRAGILMSRITNDTLAMQAALSQVSSDALQTTGFDHFGDSGSALHGLEIYFGDPLSLPQLHRAHSNLWPPRPPSGAEPAGKRGTNGGNDAGNVRRHSRG